MIRAKGTNKFLNGKIIFFYPLIWLKTLFRRRNVSCRPRQAGKKMKSSLSHSGKRRGLHFLKYHNAQHFNNLN
jgi:hypothetical protein